MASLDDDSVIDVLESSLWLGWDGIKRGFLREKTVLMRLRLLALFRTSVEVGTGSKQNCFAESDRAVLLAVFSP